MTSEEQALRTQLTDVFQQIKQKHAANNFQGEERELLHALMSGLARALHASLAHHGKEPKHTSTMISNRRLQPRDHGFYEHIHTVEDLLNQI